MSNDSPKLRTIRSFVRREGRMTDAQRHALEALWEKYGVTAGAGRLDLDALFGRTAPRHLEIGFGMGDALCAMAQAYPEHDYLGIEVHRPGVGSFMQKARALELSNVRMICADAVEVLGQMIPDGALDAVYLFFPDPWPKRRHHKRRILTPAFAALVARKLKPGGRFHMATDWEDYARQMMEVMSAMPGFTNAAGSGQFSPRPEYRPLTKFERRGQRLGHGIWDLVFARLQD
ncbi:MAG: tRNA (guanosine(46)-N7)-methyltransferase TrmB [Gammaproteobacteria bacterium]|nr:tRNA (guanosine(46)-N7)-methyltransferase TrmB [Gammaproteobacteria bacterium]